MAILGEWITALQCDSADDINFAEVFWRSGFVPRLVVCNAALCVVDMGQQRVFARWCWHATGCM
jgi:hypothetical protein